MRHTIVTWMFLSILFIGCNAPLATNPTPVPTLVTIKVYTFPEPDIEYPTGFSRVWPYPDQTLPLTAYLNGGVDVSIFPSDVNPLLADDKGVILYSEPQLSVDGNPVTSVPEVYDEMWKGCKPSEGRDCEPDEYIGVGPFRYTYPVVLQGGIHHAKATWEAYDGQIHEYSWSFTLTD